MLTKEQTEVVTSSMSEKIAPSTTNDVTAGVSTEIDAHRVAGLRIPKIIPTEEWSEDKHYNDWPNTQGVSSPSHLITSHLTPLVVRCRPRRALTSSAPRNRLHPLLRMRHIISHRPLQTLHPNLQRHNLPRQPLVRLLLPSPPFPNPPFLSRLKR